MADAIPFEHDRRELAHRSADGVEVTLLWDARDDAVAVRVLERTTGRILEIPVARDHALNAFNHPYAYAALQETCTPAAVRAAA